MKNEYTCKPRRDTGTLTSPGNTCRLACLSSFSPEWLCSTQAPLSMTLPVPWGTKVRATLGSLNCLCTTHPCTSYSVRISPYLFLLSSEIFSHPSLSVNLADPPAALQGKRHNVSFHCIHFATYPCVRGTHLQSTPSSAC